MDDDEEDVNDEEQGDEENEADLLNLNDEDLKDLEREMDELRQEEDEEEAEQSDKPRKKYPKSAVDDKFFSLAEMAAFLDEQDRMEGTGPSVLDSVDDSETAPADYRYEDFFGREDTIEESESANQKERKKKRNVAEKESRKKKSVRFAMDEEQAEKEVENDESVHEDDNETEQGPVLLGEQEEAEQPQTSLKKSLKRLKQTIAKLEQENLAPRSWQLSGEVTAQQREENELLETHVQFDHGAKKAPEITEVFTEKLEDLIKQRIKDKAFDDVVRKKRVEERTEPYRNQAIEEQEIVKTSLAEVYEKEYQKAAGEAAAPNTVNEEHVAIEKRMRELFRLIDALSNFDYTPPEKDGTHIVQSDPSAEVVEMFASSIGARSQSARTYLERHLDKFREASADDLIRHALLALRDTLPAEENLTSQVRSCVVL
ncbi:Mpp10 protein [Cooperia oncophora]